ncbi:MAG TPA: hypothetical protein VG942_10500 [Hyphomonadaceae bacterium]|nr:hypothetical protein [Hyphomonadaceae bacterium]
MNGPVLDVLTIFHFLGLGLTAAGAFGGVVVMGHRGTLPGKRGGGPKAIGPILTRMSIFGIVLLWGTGLALLIITGVNVLASAMFWMKMGFAALLTFAAIATEFTYSSIRAGNQQAAHTLLSLGPLAALAFVVTLVFAVLAFH